MEEDQVWRMEEVVSNDRPRMKCQTMMMVQVLLQLVDNCMPLKSRYH